METYTEAYLEGHLRTRVRRDLLGHVVKIVPVEKGVPDDLVLLPGGRLYLVELKTETGRLSKAQEVWHARHTELRGGTVYVLRGKAGVDAWVDARAAEGVL